VREKHCWLAENKRLKAQANRLRLGDKVLVGVKALLMPSQKRGGKEEGP
jgi:hypothetical protein